MRAEDGAEDGAVTILATDAQMHAAEDGAVTLKLDLRCGLVKIIDLCC